MKNNYSFNSNIKKTLATFRAICLAVILGVFACFNNAFGGVNITVPTLPVITGCSFPTPYTPLGDIVITETLVNDISTFGTLILTAPANFEFLNLTGNVNFTGGMDISSITGFSVNATTITLTINGSTFTNLDVITISGIQVRGINGASGVAQNATRTGGSSVIAGDVNGAAHATFTSFLNSVTGGTIDTDQTICSNGDPANLSFSIASTADGTPSYQWQSGTDGITFPSNLGTNVSYDPPSGLTLTTYYRCITTSTLNTVACSDTSNMVTVTVNPIPAITNAATDTICSGTDPNISLAATAASTFSWTIGTITGGITGASAGSGADINQTLTNPGNATAGSVEYLVTPTSIAGSCVGAAFTITVTVNPIPAITNPATATICSGTDPDISLTASAASNFTWTIGIITGGITGASAGSGADINQILTNPSNVTDGTVPYLVTPTSTAGSCLGAGFTITVTVTHAPDVTNAATASTCSGTNPNIGLTATEASSFTWTIGSITGGITGGSAGSGDTITQILTNPSNATNGTIEYSVIPTSSLGALCVGTAFTITVTVNPKPVVDNAATKSICNAASTDITLSASTASSFSWTVGTITGGITGALAGSGAAINQVLTNPSNATDGTVEYLVTPTSTIGTCIGDAFTITVTVNPKPELTNSATDTICSGTDPNIALAASAASSFAWTIGAVTGGITGANIGSGATLNQILTNPSDVTDGAVEYDVTPTSTTGLCTGDVFTITIAVTHAPTVSNAAADTICSGTGPNIALTASEASTFTWTIGTITGGITGASAGSGATINQVLTNPSNAVAGTVEYLVTPTSTLGALCTGSAFTITVTVDPIPVVTNPASKSICHGISTNIALTASEASSFSWTIGTITGGILGTNPGSGTTINEILTNPSNAAAGSAEYLVTPTSIAGSCVGAAFTITVIVNPSPDVTNGATASTCSGTAPDLALTASAASSFAWTIGAITGGITGAGVGSGATLNQILTNPSNAVDGTVEYYVTPTSTTGLCIGDIFTITVTAIHAPTVTSAAAASTCSGTDPNIALTASEASTFTWTIGTITGSISGAGAGSGGTINQVLTNPSNAVAGTIEYLVIPTSSIGALCAGPAFAITVTVDPTPAVTNPATRNICNATSTNIPLTASAASTFTWTTGAITGGITGSGAGAGATINQVLSNPSSITAGTVEYFVTPTSTVGTCIGAAFTITVTVNPTPVVTNAATATTCGGTGPNIALTASAASSFSWTIGTITGGITGALASSGGIINQTLNNPSDVADGTVEYIVTPTSSAGSCLGPAFTITITVNPAPAVSNSATKNICTGTSANIVLAASTASSFSWTIGTITGGITGAAAGSGGTINQILTNPNNTAAGTVEYIVTPTSTTGSCVGAPLTITVTVYPTPAVTNAATKDICNATSTNISLIASVASSFSWVTGTITGGITGSGGGSGATINQTLTNPSNASAGSVQYLITPTSTSGTCIGTAFSITVTVNPTPEVTSPDSASSCSGSGPNIALTASAASSFSWTIGTITGSITGALAGSGGTINQVLTNPSTVTNGTVEYLVTPTSTTGLCAGPVFTITDTVNPTPSVTNLPTKSICSATGTNIALTASTASSFSWTVGTITGGITGAGAGSGAAINQLLTNPNNVTAGTVQYLVTPTSTTSLCVGPVFTITVTVNPTPVVSNAATKSICNATGTDISLISSTASTFTWTIGAITGGITGSSAGSGATINQILTNPSDVNSGTVPYLVVPTSSTGSCVGASYTITVTVNPTPVVNNAATATICSGTGPNIALISSAPSSFSWTIGTVTGGITGAVAGSGSTINQTLTNPVDTTDGTVEYLVTPTSTTGLCVGPVFTITVTVNPTPSVTNLPTKSICNATSTNIPLTASTASSFAWAIGTITGGITGAGAGSGATINQILTNPGNATAGTVEYLVTPTSTVGSCIGATFTITVTVYPTPAITNAATATICSGTSPNIPLTASAASSFAWTIGAITGGITGASASSGATINQTLTNPGNVSSGTVQYIVTPTSTSGSCVGAAFTITVTVNPVPAITNVATATICSGTSPNIALTSSVASSFSWTIGTITGDITGALAGSGAAINQTLTNPDNVTDGTVEYLVTPTSTTGLCVGPVFTITVTVNPTPSVTNLPTKSICNATSTNIPLTASTASSFAWAIGTITGGITGAGAGSGATINQILTNPGNATAGNVEYLVTPTSTVGSCVGAAFTITVTVNPTPAITNAATATICSGTGANIALTASAASSFAWTIGAITGGITGASASSGATINQTLTNPSDVSSGTIQYIVTPTTTTGSCVGAAFTITITVNPAPVISNAATDSICSETGPNIALTASIPSSFTWTIGTITGGITGALAASGNTINQTLTNPSNITDGAVEYIVTPTSIAGLCAGAAFTITVTVTPIPTVTNAATKSICNATGTNIPLTASAASSFTWTIGTVTGGITGAGAGSGVTINQTLTNPSNATAGTVEYLVTPTSTVGSCVGAAFTITVTVNPTPAITNAATDTICSGTGPNMALTASAASSFTWTIGTITGGITGASAGSGATINQTLTNPSNTTAGTVEYIVTPTSTTGLCVGAAFTITITINPSPLVTNAATDSICSGTGPNIGLTSSIASSFTWTIGTITGGITGALAGSGDTINQILTNPSSISDGTVEYIVTPTSIADSCEGAAFVITVTVNYSPTVTNAATTITCGGTSPNIALTATEVSTFTWTIGAITGGITGALAGSGDTINQILTNPGNTTDGTVQYIVTPTSTATSCVGDAFTITVTVNPLPAITNTPADSICTGTDINIPLTSSVASSFTWTIGVITGGITGSSGGSGAVINQTLTNPSNTTAGTVEYIVTPTSTAGSCAGAPFTITVTVNVIPIAIFTGGTNQTVCSGTALPTPIELSTSNSVAGTTFNWTRNNTTNVTGTTSGSGDITGLVLTNTTDTIETVTFTITPTGPNSSFCVGSDITTTIIVNPDPVLSSSFTPAAICSGDTFSYTATSTTTGSTFTWSRPAVADILPATSSGTGDVSEPLTNTSTLPLNVTYVYQVSANGCLNPALFNVVVEVKPLPVLFSSLSPPAICSGSIFSYTPTSATPGTSFAWARPVITGISNGVSNGTDSPEETLNDTTYVAVNVKYGFTLTADGCTNPVSDTVVVAVKPTALLSNSLTPPAICSGTVFNYVPASLTAGATFAWSRAAVPGISNLSANGINNPAETLMNTLTDPVSVSYLFTTTANSCSYDENVIVVVNPTPTLSSTLFPSGICSGDTFSYIPLSLTAGATFSWARAAVIGISNPPGAGNDNPNEALTNTTGADINVTYVYTVSANGCTNSSTDSVMVPVNLVPELSSNTAPAGICSGDTFSYSPLSGTPGTTFLWSRAAVAGISNLMGSGNGNPNEPLTNTTENTVNVTYIYTLTANGCTNPVTYTVTVAVYPTPSLSSSLTPPEICNGMPFNYIVSSLTTGASFTWTRNVVAGISNAAGNGSDSISEVLTNTTIAPVGVTYVYTVSANGCSTNFNVLVMVNPTPLLTSSLAPDSICSGTLFNYSPQSSTAGATFTWTRAVVADISEAAGNGSGNPNENLTNTSTAVVNVTYVYTVLINGCSNPSTYNVVVPVNPTPLFTSSLGPIVICSGTAVAYNPSSGTSGTLFSWARAAVSGISNIGANGTGNPGEVLTNTTADPVDVTYIYTLSANGCTNPIAYSVVVTVNPAPSLSTPLTPPAICSGTAFSYAPQSLTAGTSFAWTRAAQAGISNVSGGGADNPNEVLFDSTASPVNVTYVYTLSANSCTNTTTYNVVVTVNPIPALSSSLTPPGICSGEIFNYAPLSLTVGTSFAWTRATVPGISNPVGNGTGNPNEILTDTTVNPVNVTYVYILSANTCMNPISYNVVVAVNPIPTLTSSLTSPAVCSGTAFGYTPTSNTPGTLFSWTRAAVPGISNIGANGSGNPNEVLINTTAAAIDVTYVYTLSANGCTNPVTYSVIVSVTPTPVLTSTPSPNAICSGGFFNYVPTSQLTGVTFLWSRAVVPGLSNIAGSGNGQVGETLTLSDTIPVNVTYIFTLSSGLCTNAITFPVTFTVNKPCICNHQLTSTLLPQAICDSGAFSYTPLSSTPGATFDWVRAQVAGISNPAGSGTDDPNETLFNTTNTAIEVTYVYSITANGCTNPVTFNVVVTVYPTPTFGSSLTPPAICSGTIFSYNPSSSTTAASYTWSRAVVAGISNGSGNGTGNPNENLSNSSSAPVNVTYEYTVSANGCTNAATYSVIVAVDPVTIGGDVSGNATVCSGSNNGSLLLNGHTGNVVRWEYSIDGGNTWGMVNNTSSSLIYNNLTTTIIYHAVVQSGTCVIENSTDDTITVNSGSVGGIISGNASVCSNANAGTLALNGYSGDILNWVSSINNGGTWTPVSNTTGAQSYSYTNLATTTWYMALVKSGVCPVDTASIAVITVNQNPVASFTSTTVCLGQTTTFTNSSNVNGGTISLNLWDFGDSSYTSSALNKPVLHTYNNAGTYDVTLVVTSNNGCETTVTANTVVNAMPDAQISSSGPLFLCSGNSITLSAVADSGSTYLWNPGGATTQDLLVDTAGIYTLTVTNSSGCVNSGSVSVASSLIVNAGIDITIDAGSSATLHGTGGLTYSWSPVTGLDNPTIADPVVTPSETTTYVLTATDANGCAGTDSLIVTVLSSNNLIISNVMTPNGDGKNDTWIIVNIELFPNTEIVVVNNQGQEVYKSSSYDNSWDGTFKGKPLPDATYYYFLKFATGDKVFSGAITIFNDN